MSLAALAVRIATVYALRGKTIAGQNVKDSPQNPIPEVLNCVQMAVYTGKHTVSPEVRDMIGGDQSCDLSIHMHIPAEVDVTDGASTITLNAAAGGVGVIFDVMWRQVVRALMVDAGPWGDIWRSFVVKVGDIESEPFLIETEKGSRIQARDIMIPVETICDPAFGTVVAGSPWAALLAAMRNEPALHPLAAVIEHEISSPSALPSWTQARVALGLTEAELAASGLSPLTSGMVEPVTEWTVNDGEGGTLVVTEDQP